MRGRFGGYDESKLIEFQQKFDYAGGGGQPCGASHISPAYTCRVGAGDPSYRTEMVKQLLSGTYDDYAKEYAEFRQSERKASTDEILNRIYGNSNKEPSTAAVIELNKADKVRLAAAEQTLSTFRRVAEMDSMGSKGVKAANDLVSQKTLYEGMKWEMDSDFLLVSSGSLDLAWDGVQLDKSYKSQFPNDKSAKFGQSRAGVDEHPYPTKALKSGLRELKPSNSRELMDFVMQRNLRSITSAPEDQRFSQQGMKSTTPNPKVVMARYDAAKVRTFILDNSITSKARDTQRTISNSVKIAKDRGMTKEEWISSIIKLPGSAQPPSIFAKPKAAKVKTSKPKAAKAKAAKPASKKSVGMANWSKTRLQAALDRAYNSGNEAKVAEIRGILGGMS